MVERTCCECGEAFLAKTERRMFCSQTCREMSRRFPCAVCGEPMYPGKAVLPPGEARHKRCWLQDADGNVIHGLGGYRSSGCRCDECRAANVAAAQAWQRKHGYWSRPDVVARRKVQRSEPRVKRQQVEQWSRYYKGNRAAEIRRAADKWARRKGAPTIQFTLQQLEDRLSMFAGCWMCGCALDGGFHVDHVKPLARGGWHCLSNLRPSCPTCNISKGAKWPLETALVLTSSG